MIESHKEGTLFRVHVQPKASRNAIKVEENGSIRIYLTAPPTEGAANKALMEIMAKWLDVPKRRIKIVSGQSSRRKAVLIKEMEPIIAAALLKKQ